MELPACVLDAETYPVNTRDMLVLCATGLETKLHLRRNKIQQGVPKAMAFLLPKDKDNHTNARKAGVTTLLIFDWPPFAVCPSKQNLPQVLGCWVFKSKSKRSKKFMFWSGVAGVETEKYFNQKWEKLANPFHKSSSGDLSPPQLGPPVQLLVPDSFLYKKPGAINPPWSRRRCCPRRFSWCRRWCDWRHTAATETAAWRWRCFLPGPSAREAPCKYTTVQMFNS